MRKITVITTTRAEYGIMSRLISKLYYDKDVDFSLLVSGSHLSEKFGNTWHEINVPITKKIDIEIEKEPAHSMAIAVEKFNQAFKEIQPDIIVILGDRYEIMAVAIAAMLNNIPIAHIHGGETTQGAIDDAIRHSLTKLSHLHFASCEAYRKRIIQLGEAPERVFNVGALGIENIKEIPLLSKNELENMLALKFKEKNILMTFHPVTLEKGSAKVQVTELISALKELKDTNIIVTMPNSDEGSNDIFREIDEFANYNENVHTYKSLGLVRYLSTLQFVDMVVGNSSSGILEVPSFKIPTINIGNRQKGRICAESVINCLTKKQDIIDAIEKGYKMDCTNVKNPFEGNNTANKIIEILKTFNTENILSKKFYDLDF